MNRFGMELREYRLNRQRDRYIANLATSMDLEDEGKIFYWTYMVEAVEEEMEEEGYEIC